MELPFEIKMPKDEIELEELVFKVYNYSRAQSALECSLICDKQRGFLSLGDMIRKEFGLVEFKEKKKPKLERVK